MNKKLVIITFIINLIASLIFAYFIISTHDDIVTKREEKRYIAVQHKRIKLYFFENFPLCKSITFTHSEIAPMGSYSIKGYINHDKSLDFLLLIGDFTDFNYQGDIDAYDGDKLGKYINNQEHPKTVDEIIKEKHLNPKDYEYPWP